MPHAVHISPFHAVLSLQQSPSYKIPGETAPTGDSFSDLVQKSTDSFAVDVPRVSWAENTDSESQPDKITTSSDVGSSPLVNEISHQSDAIEVRFSVPSSHPPGTGSEVKAASTVSNSLTETTPILPSEEKKTPVSPGEAEKQKDREGNQRVKHAIYEDVDAPSKSLVLSPPAALGESDNSVGIIVQATNIPKNTFPTEKELSQAIKVSPKDADTQKGNNLSTQANTPQHAAAGKAGSDAPQAMETFSEEKAGNSASSSKQIMGPAMDEPIGLHANGAEVSTSITSSISAPAAHLTTPALQPQAEPQAPPIPVKNVGVPVPSPYDKIDQGVAPVLLHSGAQHVAVGIHDPDLGWVEIKTQSAVGHVDATLVTASGATHASLAARLPAIADYMTGRDVRVGTLAVHHEAASTNMGGSQNSGYSHPQNNGHGNAFGSSNAGTQSAGRSNTNSASENLQSDHATDSYMREGAPPHKTVSYISVQA